MTKTYKHCVFCASNESCPKAIYVATRIAKEVSDRFDLDHDVVESAYHSDVEVVDEGANTSVWMSNDTLSQLIDDCMIFAVELSKSNKRYGI